MADDATEASIPTTAAPEAELAWSVGESDLHLPAADEDQTVAYPWTRALALAGGVVAASAAVVVALATSGSQPQAQTTAVPTTQAPVTVTATPTPPVTVTATRVVAPAPTSVLEIAPTTTAPAVEMSAEDREFVKKMRGHDQYGEYSQGIPTSALIAAGHRVCEAYRAGTTATDAALTFTRYGWSLNMAVAIADDAPTVYPDCKPVGYRGDAPRATPVTIPQAGPQCVDASGNPVSTYLIGGVRNPACARFNDGD